jgi:hypothetical protein
MEPWFSEFLKRRVEMPDGIRRTASLLFQLGDKALFPKDTTGGFKAV